MKWNPIIGGEAAKPYQEIIEAIKVSIFEQQIFDRRHPKPNIMYDKAGILLFFVYYLKSMEDDVLAQKIEPLIDVIIEELSNTPEVDLELGMGAAGIAWGLQHLHTCGLLESGIEEAFEYILEDCVTFSKDCLEEGNYDYLVGGLGTFLLNLENCNTIDVLPLLELLLRNAIQVDDFKCTWKYYDIQTDKIWDNYNLGLSHGVPSVIMLLGLVYEKHPSLTAQIMPYIKHGLNWLYATKNPIDQPSLYSSFTTGVPNEDYTALKWCYGDMGIAFCYYLTGKRINDEFWMQEGIDTLLQCASRLDIELCTIEDAHICHGTAGIGHMFNRMYQYTHREEFKIAAQLCFETIFSKATYKDGHIQFIANKGDFGHLAFYGLMEGSAGIALTLLAATTEIEPRWDRIFLLC